MIQKGRTLGMKIKSSFGMLFTIAVLASLGLATLVVASGINLQSLGEAPIHDTISTRLAFSPKMGDKVVFERPFTASQASHTFLLWLPDCDSCIAKRLKFSMLKDRLPQGDRIIAVVRKKEFLAHLPTGKFFSEVATQEDVYFPSHQGRPIIPSLTQIASDGRIESVEDVLE